MKVWIDQTRGLGIRKAESGWVVERFMDRGGMDPTLIAGLSDDEALLEFFAEQLALPAPDLRGNTPQPVAHEASAAAIVPPPVSAEVAAALEPFANLARVMRDKGGVEMVTYRYDEVTNRESEIELSHVHDLLRAAGLFTDDMRPSQPAASQDAAADASVKPAGDSSLPPADGDDGEVII